MIADVPSSRVVNCESGKTEELELAQSSKGYLRRVDLVGPSRSTRSTRLRRRRTMIWMDKVYEKVQWEIDDEVSWKEGEGRRR